MNSRSQSRTSSIDCTGRCLLASIRGTAKSFTGIRNRVPRCFTSNHRCSRHRRALRHAPLHRLLIAIRPPSHASAPWCSRDSSWRPTRNPVEHVAWVKPPAPDAEPLRDEQSSQVRATNRLLVTADKFRDLESGQQTVRQFSISRRSGVERNVRRQRRFVIEISSRVDPQGVMDLGPITRLRRLGGRVQSRCTGLAL